MKPIRDNIFAQKIKEEQKTASGIILPQKTKTANLYKVLAIGNKVQHIKVGDTVKKFNGAIRPVIDYHGTDVEVLRENGDIEFVNYPLPKCEGASEVITPTSVGSSFRFFSLRSTDK